MRPRVLFTLVPALVALLVVPAVASALTYGQAVDKLVDDGYPQSIETWLTQQGTSDIGFAFGGSSADTARAQYLAAKLKALGFNVKLEAVPLDRMEFKGASVTVGQTAYVASTFGGVRGTPPGGITGQLVYVGGGTAPEVAAAGDLTGKIAVVDAKLTSYWMNWQWTEPALAGAAGIVYTGIAADEAYYAEPTSLGSFDAEYRYALAPVVYISQSDGTALKTALAGDPSLQATMVNDCEMTLAPHPGQLNDCLDAVSRPSRASTPCHRRSVVRTVVRSGTEAVTLRGRRAEPAAPRPCVLLVRAEPRPAAAGMSPA